MKSDKPSEPNHPTDSRLLTLPFKLLAYTVTFTLFLVLALMVFRMSILEFLVPKYVYSRYGIPIRLKLISIESDHLIAELGAPDLGVQCDHFELRYKSLGIKDIEIYYAHLSVMKTPNKSNKAKLSENIFFSALEIEGLDTQPLKPRVKGSLKSPPIDFDISVTPPRDFSLSNLAPIALIASGSLSGSFGKLEFTIDGQLSGIFAKSSDDTPISFKGKTRVIHQYKDFATTLDLNGKLSANSSKIAVKGNFKLRHKEVSRQFDLIVEHTQIDATLNKNLVSSEFEQINLELEKPRFTVRKDNKTSGKPPKHTGVIRSVNFPAAAESISLKYDLTHKALEWSVNKLKIPKLIPALDGKGKIEFDTKSDFTQFEATVSPSEPLFTLAIKCSLNPKVLDLQFDLPLNFAPDFLQPDYFSDHFSTIDDFIQSTKPDDDDDVEEQEYSAFKGSVHLSGSAKYQINQERLSEFPVHVQISNFEFKSGETKIAGISTDLTINNALDFESPSKVKLGPTLIRIEHIGEGDLAFNQTDLKFEKSENKISVTELRTQWADGKLAAEPFKVSLTPVSFSTKIVVSQIEIENLLSLAKEGQVQAATGKLSGEIPVAYYDGDIRVLGAHLEAREAGLLKIPAHLTGNTPETIDTLDEFEQLVGQGSDKLVMKALENFNFEKLEMEFNSSPDIGTHFTFNMRGSNPDLIPSTKKKNSGAPFEFRDCQYYTPLDIKKMIAASLSSENAWKQKWKKKK